MPNTLLVTGGAGFIGSNFVHYWLRNHPEDSVIVLDSLTYAGNRASLAAVEKHPNFFFQQGDICNTDLVESLLRERGVNSLVHFAAESHVDRSISGPDAFIETNIIGTHSLLKAARSVWLSGDGLDHRFHHVSTDEVYGSLQQGEPAFTELHRYEPNSPYSASKAASDHLVRAYHHTYGLQVTTSNCSNNYGPYHFPEKLIPLAITNLLRGRKIPIYGSGENVRDWLHVEDHARGIELVLQRGVVGETYNIGGNNEWTNLALIRLLCETVDARFREEPRWQERYPDCPAAKGESCVDALEFVTDRAGHDLRYAIDNSVISSQLGYQPKWSFEDGLRDTVGWYLNNPVWWEPLLSA